MNKKTYFPSIKIYFVVAIGVFLANWLVVPLTNETMTHKNGFFVGLLAALIVITLISIAKLISWWISKKF